MDELRRGNDLLKPSLPRIREEDLWLYFGLIMGMLARPDVYAYVGDVIANNETSKRYLRHLRDTLTALVPE